MTNEEPLVVMEACVNIVWEIVRENCGDSRSGVIRKGETPLRRCGCRGVREGSFGAEHRDVGCDWGSGVHRGLEVFASRGSDKNVIGVHGNVLVERGEEESVEDFLGDSRGSGRHR